MKTMTYILITIFLSIQVKAQIDMDSIIKLRKGNPVKALIVIDKQLFANNTPDSLQPQLYREKGYAYQNINDFDNSIIALNKARNTFDPDTQARQVYNVEIQLSYNYSRLNKQVEAIKFANLAMQRAEKLDDKELIIKANDNFSYVYFMLGQLDKAINYLQVSQQFHVDNNNQQELSVTYNNLAILYRNKGDYQQCIDYNNKSLSINMQLDDYTSVAKSYNNLGIVYNQINDPKRAIEYFTRSIELNDSLQIINSNPLISLARLQGQRQDWLGQSQSLIKALHLEQQTGRLDVQKSIYQSLLTNSLNLKLYQDATYYQSNIQRIDKELELRKNKENLQLITTHKQLLENQRKWQEQKQQTATYQWVALSVFLLSLAFGVYFFQRQAQHNILRQKERALLENKVLRSQMNPHFIYNALTAIQNTVINNKALEAASYISKFAKLIRQNFDFVQQEWITLHEDLDALHNYIQTQQFRFNNSFNYDIQVHTHDAVDELKIPPMLLQPFVENAIEHGLKNIDRPGLITIIVNQHTYDRLHFTIIDNGTGYQPKPDNKLHAIQIIKDRLKIYNPKDADSFKIINLGKNKGTKVEYTLSLKL